MSNNSNVLFALSSNASVVPTPWLTHAMDLASRLDLPIGDIIATVDGEVVPFSPEEFEATYRAEREAAKAPDTTMWW